MEAGLIQTSRFNAGFTEEPLFNVPEEVTSRNGKDQPDLCSVAGSGFAFDTFFYNPTCWKCISAIRASRINRVV
ncbi:MAG: hypothetical protein U0Z17_11680 [Bacteroidales bacterium]